VCGFLTIISGSVIESEFRDSVALSSDLCPRLQITNGLAFVYDPIIIESQSASYLLDWGRKAVNQSIETYITHGQAGNLVFHTFLFPVKPVRWQYIHVLDHKLMFESRTLGFMSVRTLGLSPTCGWCGQH
jgi:hypothetical protein